MSNNLILSRMVWLSDPSIQCPEGTFGKLTFPDGSSYFTCENPWKNNQAHVSCIPEGVYQLEQRYSPVVQRTSNGKYSEGWEVTDVPDRTYIMVHPGNWPSDVEGCIAVGKSLGIIQDRKGRWSLAVLNSQDAFKEIMEKMGQYNTWNLDIRTYFPDTY